VSTDAPRRSWGGSLVARLLAIALVPLLAVGRVGWTELRDEQRIACAATSLVELTALERDVTAVLAPAYIEYLAHVGLATIDSFGIDRATVSQLTGVDYDQVYRSNAELLDEVLDAVIARHQGVRLPGPRLLGDVLRDVERRLTDLRRQTETRAGDTEFADRVFADLSAALEEAVDVVQDDLDVRNVPADLIRFRAEIRALRWTLTTAGDAAESVLATVTRSGDHLDAVTSALAAHRQAAAQFAELLPPDQARGLVGVVAGVPDPRDDIPTGFVDLETFVVELATTFSAHVLDEIDYLRALARWADGYYAEVAAEVEDQSVAAEQSVREFMVGLALVLLVVIVAVAVVAQSLLRPLLRLGRHATRLARGDLDLPPLPERGPRDLRHLTHTVNAMHETLLAVDRQAAALASGRLHDPVLRQTSPGRLGESIRRSVARLAQVTTRLHESEQRASAIVSHAAVAIWTIDEQGRVVSANAAAQRALGRPEEAQVGRRLTGSVASLVGEHEIVRPDGTRVWLDVDQTVVDAGGHRLRTVIGEDITERKEFERRLAHQARHDVLTGLANRFAVLERLHQRTDEITAAAADPPIAGVPPTTATMVLFIDVDGFKTVNDTRGHAVGDQVLAEVGRRLRSAVRSGALVGRLGGDEFVVVADLFGEVGAVALGRRLIEHVEQPFEIDGSLFAISASVGVSAIAPGDAPLDVLHRADAAVYHAKHHGRGRVEVYDEALQARVEERAEMALAMRDAIARGELVMHLQPIVDLATLRPTGAEALARWCRPGYGNVSPTEFVAVAENSSLIIELTRLMLSEACGRLAAWRRADPDCSLRISVNLSSRHLVDGDLVGDLAEAITASGADPRMLELELTETQLLADFDTARRVLETVRASGVTVAVDDFGTGFSSMAYLRQLQVDAIKVDRSFVAGAGQHGFDSTAIDAMVNFGRVLGVEVVAEGVETHEQLEFVRSRGCTRAQGYLFGRPMPPAEAEEVLGISPSVPALAAGPTRTSGDGAAGAAPTVALHAGNAER